jgi:hypothetical protein
MPRSWSATLLAPARSALRYELEGTLSQASLSTLTLITSIVRRECQLPGAR